MSVVKERSCLRCAETFLSEGAGNRICDVCRKGKKRTTYAKSSVPIISYNKRTPGRGRFDI